MISNNLIISTLSTPSFSANGQQTIVPRDPSVTSVGNSQLSPLDIQKMRCLYNCNGTETSGCGGHHYGHPGISYGC